MGGVIERDFDEFELRDFVANLGIRLLVCVEILEITLDNGSQCWKIYL